MSSSNTVGRRAVLGGLVVAPTLGLVGCGGSGFSSGETSSAPASQSGPVKLSMLVAANAGSADLAALQKAVDAWTAKTGNSVDLQPASDMNQQLSQGFAAGNPPDVFWVDASLFPTYAKAQYLYPYGDQLSGMSFYEPLKQAFTWDGKLYGAPKDFSTLGLVINTDLWTKAGLTDADIPTTWEKLHDVAKRLTTGDVQGLVIGDTRDRVGAFMVEAGGWFVDDQQKTMTADTAQNAEALTFVQTMLKDGSAKFPKQVDAGWGGEAMGKGKCAMTIEGNWIKGALTKDYPTIQWRVAELPTGPKGKGTLTFTQMWGIAAQSKNQAAALDFVKSIYTDAQQVEFANVFGVMPSLVSARDTYAKSVSDKEKAWLAGAEYAQGPVSAPGMDPVMKDFDTQLQALATTDPKTILASVQKNGEAALKG